MKFKVSPLQKSQLAGLSLLLIASLGCKQLSDLRGETGEAPSASTAPAAVASAPTETKPASPADEPSGIHPLPFAVGQWTTYKLTKAGKPNGSFLYEITGEEAGGHWLKVLVSDNEGKAAEVDMLLAFKGVHSYENLDVKKARVKLPNGATQSIEGVALKVFLKSFEKHLNGLMIDNLTNLPSEDVIVPMGKFTKAYYRDVDMTIAGIRSKGRVWNHTRVPISAMVKHESVTQGEEALVELTGFGFEGAPSK